jgi:hypothetical protein
MRYWADEMYEQVWLPAKADPDVWISDKVDHYEYLAVWVDDLLYVGKDSKGFFGLLKEKGYTVKGVGSPTYHLGGDFVRVTEPENVLNWGSHTFLKMMLLKYKKMFGEEVPKSEIHAPLEPGDHPSCLCTPGEKGYYMSMIGDFQWSVSLGPIDIYAATLTSSGFHAAPRIGHLEGAKCAYRYIRNYKKTSIKFRTEKCDHSTYDYVKPNFGYIYHPCKEDIPVDAPTPKGKSIQMTTFFDANLLFEYTTGKSATGILHLYNKTPIDWYSSNNSPVECATYSIEFTSMKIALEQIIVNQIELRYLGCHIDSPIHLFGDIKSVIDTSNVSLIFWVWRD